MNKRKPAFKFTCLFFFLFVNLYDSSGQPGFLDSTFNGTGVVYKTNPSSKQSGLMFGYSSTVQTDGKLLVVGEARDTFSFDPVSHCIILRYNENGLLDSSFGKAGLVTIDFGLYRDYFESIAVQKDGNIIAGGGFNVSATFVTYSKGILVRYKANGDLDSTFGSNGKIIIDFNPGTDGYNKIGAIKILTDGKILVGSNGLMAKYHSNGSVDSSYGVNGILRGVCGNLEMQDDGKIICIGVRKVASIENFEVTRYHSNGQLDLSFNGVGFVNTFIDVWGAKPIVAKSQPSGKILVAGIVPKLNYYVGNDGRSWQTSDNVMVRYLNNGMIDSSFGTNGKVITNIGGHDFPSKIELQSDGKILVSGISGGYYALNQGPFVLARYLPDGKLDSTFGFKGIKVYSSGEYPSEQGNNGMVLKNNRIYLSGWSNQNSSHSTGAYTLAIQNDGIPYSPNSINVCQGSASTNFISDFPGSSYQWQLSTDSVAFNNISNNSEYSGANSPNLTVNNIPSYWYGYQYRCMVDNGVSNLFTIKISNVWTGAVSTAWEIAANWSCGVVPDANTDVIINSGDVDINSNTIIRSLTTKSGATITVANGFKLTISH